MIGGNAVMKVIPHSMSHPNLKFFHFSAYGSSQANIRSLKTRNRIPNTIAPTRAMTDSTF